MNTPDSSPEVPHTVDSLQPHRWQRKTVNAGHIQLTRWEPGTIPSIKSQKPIQQPIGRATRSKAMDEQQPLEQKQQALVVDPVLEALLKVVVQ
jgi:hypothetical protein